jgi:hypothetical protein
MGCRDSGIWQGGWDDASVSERQEGMKVFVEGLGKGKGVNCTLEPLPKYAGDGRL